VSDSENQKQVLEILRVSSRFFIQNQISTRVNIIPFLVLLVIGYAMIFDSSLVDFGQLLGQADQSSGTSGPNTIVSVPITPIAISIGLLLLFTRFGFTLFHGMDLACSNKNLIVTSSFDSDKETVLLSSFKDAYLIDSFLIFLNHHKEVDSVNLTPKRFLSAIINVALIFTLLFGQSIVIAVACNVSLYLSVLLALLYFVLFLVFYVKLSDIRRLYPMISVKSIAPRAFILILYFAQAIISALLSLNVIVFYLSAGPINDIVKYKNGFYIFDLWTRLTGA
jgi:hypothetical protein